MQATAKARGRIPDLRGLLLPPTHPPKPQRLLKTNSSRKAKAGVVEHAYTTVTQKVGTEDHEFQVILLYIDC